MTPFRKISQASGCLLILLAAACSSKEDAAKAIEADSGAFTADAGSDVSSQGDGAVAPFVRISSPAAGETLAGDVEIEFDFSGPQAARVFVGVEGEPLDELHGGKGQVFISTHTIADGPQTLVVRVQAEDGRQWEDTREVVFDNPDQQLERLQADTFEYHDGQSISLTARYSDADLDVRANFSVVDSAFTESQVEVENRGDGEYRITYALSEDNQTADGRYLVDVTSVNAAGEERVDRLPITLSNQSELPFVVTGATFVAGAAPKLIESQATADVLTETKVADTLLRGGSTQVTVTYRNDPERPVDKLFVTVPGFTGYYVIAAPAPEGDTTEVTLELSLPPQAPGFDDGVVGIGIGIVDGIGSIIDWVSETVTAISVGGDGVQVSLTWDTDVDLDLSVTDPMGNQVDFENPAQGEGSLDLDSNALCEIDGTRAENISWKPGDELQGVYQVRVALYSVCEEDIVTWKVTAKFCGHTEKYSGTVTTADVDMSGTGEVVTEFTVDCNQIVSGTVIREKINDISKPGIRELDVVPFAPIRVVTSSGVTTLAQGVTDNRGRYDLRFQNLDQDDYYVEVEASWVDSRTNEVRAHVTPLDDSTAHRFKTAVISGADTLVRTENPRIKVEDGSGALNVLAGIRNGYTWVAANVSTTKEEDLDPMRGHWEEGGSTSISNSYQWEDDLFIEGTTKTPQQWSDSVIMHEFMHYVVSKLSFSPLPGGEHFFEGKAAPHLMWSEGLATALGQDSLKSSVYADRRPLSSNIYDIEDLKPVLHGTSKKDDPTSNLNEFMVSSVIWDVLDPANETWDRLEERQFGFSSVFDHIPMDRTGNKLDLVDFIDQVRSDSPTLAVDEDFKCLTDHVDFPYDYPAGTMCPP